MRTFKKMHGLGNDFVIFDARETPFTPSKEFCLAVADRHRGVGYDQLIVMGPSGKADLSMLIYNADGSDAGACGNGTRCVARIFFEETGKTEGSVETAAGILKIWKEGDLFSVNFGPPRLDWQEIPLAEEKDTASLDLGMPGVPPCCCVNMGNPHAVHFIDDIETIDLETIGAQLEPHPLFPDRCNIEFAQILSEKEIRMRVFERGTGITEACGSGACATLVAAVRRRLTGREATLHLDGGDLKVHWRETDEHVILTGPAALSFEGTLSNEITNG